MENGGNNNINNLHLGSKSDLPDLDELIEANPCSKYYLAMEDCLVENNRSWKKCQQQVIHTLFSSLSLLDFNFFLFLG